MSVDWAETKAILLEVEQLFNREDDLNDTEDVQKMAEEIKMHSDNNLKTAKEIIKQMTSVVASKEAEIMAPSVSAHSANLEKYVSDKENVSSQIDITRTTIDSKREAIAHMATQALALKEKAAEFDGPSADLSDSRTAYALSLYAKISNIAWNYDKSNSGQLAGSIGNDMTSEVNSFNIDTRSKTSFEVADALWDHIAAGIEA
jgi:hypothetical protein